MALTAPLKFRAPSLVDKAAVLAAHEEQLFRTLSAIYATTGRYGTVDRTIGRARKRLVANIKTMLSAEGWIA